MNQQLITACGITRHILARFEERVNDAIATGWRVKQIDVQHRGLRIVCWALLEHERQGER